MAAQNNIFLNGLQALPFGLVPAQLFIEVLDPTIANYNTLPSKNFQIGTLWLNKINKNLWYLASKFPVNWILLSGGISNVETLTGNTGGAVGPNVNNINVVGDGTTVTVVGNPGTNTLTISALGTGTVESVTTSDGHVVTPTAGTIILANGNNITTTGTVGPNTATISLTGTTNHSVQLGNSTGSLTSLAVGATGTVLIGNTAADPSFTGSPSVSGTVTAATGITATTGNITASAGDVVITAGNLNMSAYNAAGTTGLIKFGTTIGFASDGIDNVFVGLATPPLTTLTGANNFSFGGNNLAALTTGNNNTVCGGGILRVATTANNNAVLGSGLTLGTTCSFNTALGLQVLDNLLTGISNIAIGAGSAIAFTGSETNNITVANPGVTGDSGVIRLGTTGNQLKNFQAGIRGITTDVNDAIAVLISSTGQLGTVSSSIRYKDNVQDMDDASSNIMNLRPVTFNYKQSKDIQYGLIAEEVATIMPRLAIRDSEGNPETVKYHELPQLLLNELIKLEKRVKELESKI